jgi:hypothetical protein
VRSLSNFIRTCGLQHDGEQINSLFETYQRSPTVVQQSAVSTIAISFLGIFDTVPGLTDSDTKKHDFTFHEGFHKRYCHLMASDITSNYHNLPFNKFDDFSNIPGLEVSPNDSLQVYCPGDHCNVGGGWFTSDEVRRGPALSSNTLKCSSGLEFSSLSDFAGYSMNAWETGVKSILDLRGVKGLVYKVTQVWSDIKSSKKVKFNPIKFLFDDDEVRLNRVGGLAPVLIVPLAAPVKAESSSRSRLRSAAPTATLTAPPQGDIFTELLRSWMTIKLHSRTLIVLC